MLTWTSGPLNALLSRLTPLVSSGRMQTLMRVLRQLAVAGVKEHFASGVGPDGKAWKPPKHRAGLPLRDKGLLLSSCREAGGAYSLVLVTALHYAGIHQHGGTIAKAERRRGPDEKPWVFEGRDGTVFTRHIRAHSVVIPARPFLGISVVATAGKMATAVDRLAIAPTLAELRMQPAGIARDSKIRALMALSASVKQSLALSTAVKSA